MNFSHWNLRMKIFIISYVKVWKLIKFGDLPLFSTNKDKDGKKLENSEASYNIPTLEDYIDGKMEIIVINSKARNVLYNAINGQEY